ncbi:MAG: hypothetical protein KJO55_09465, partial [Gammaproteobacteria bacterium]|nr:hypothetical protein [Gammaproteobacteria bacterium]
MNTRFLDFAERQLLLTSYGFGHQPQRCIVIVPPFAEELNKCRRMMALLGRAASDAGMGCCYLDLSGTGDSEGEFANATWQQWRDELESLLNWIELELPGVQIQLVGIRLGLLL